MLELDDVDKQPQAVNVGRQEDEAVISGDVVFPPRVLTILYICFAIVLFGIYAYTLWTNKNDPGRVNAWIVHFRSVLNGAH